MNNSLVNREGDSFFQVLFPSGLQIKNLELEMQKQLIEEIKPIAGYEARYLISNYGYAISLAKEWAMPNGGVHKKKETVLNTRLNNSGYLVIDLCKNRKLKSFSIHTLVWDYFGSQPRNGRILQVDHIDEDKFNCRIDNLQLLTSRQNIVKYHKTQKHSSQYTGVGWHKRYKKWIAYITTNGKLKHLGYFVDEIEASDEYERALKEYLTTGKVTINTPTVGRKSNQYRGV